MGKLAGDLDEITMKFSSCAWNGKSSLTTFRFILLAPSTFGSGLSMMMSCRHSYTIGSISLTLKQEHLFSVEITTDTPSLGPLLTFVYLSPLLRWGMFSCVCTRSRPHAHGGHGGRDSLRMGLSSQFSHSLNHCVLYLLPCFSFLLLSNPLSTPPFICFSFVAR